MTFRSIFIIFGAISTAWGVICLLLLPDGPSNARFLSDHEMAIAVERVASNKAGVKTHRFKPYQAFQVVRDPKTWILFVMAVAGQIPTAAVTRFVIYFTSKSTLSIALAHPMLTGCHSFASINITSFGFSTLESQYMLIPGGAIQFFGMLLGGWVATRWSGTRCAVMVVANTICIIGSGLLVGLPDSNKVSRHWCSINQKQ